jgi:hypothetical protein
MKTSPLGERQTLTIENTEIQVSRGSQCGSAIKPKEKKVPENKMPL